MWQVAISSPSIATASRRPHKLSCIYYDRAHLLWWSSSTLPARVRWVMSRAISRRLASAGSSTALNSNRRSQALEVHVVAFQTSNLECFD